MRIRSLSDKIVLYFVIIGVTAIAIVSTYSFYTSKNALLQRTFDQLTSVRVVKKNQVEQFFNDRISEFKLISTTAEISRIAIASNEPNTQQTGPFKQNLLNHLANGKYFNRMFIEVEQDIIAGYNLEKQGNIGFYILEKKERQFISTIFNRVSVNDSFIIHDYLFDSIKHKPRMFISGYSIDNEKSIKKKIALEISIDAINAIMLEQNPNDGLGTSGESYIVGPDKFMRSVSRFQPVSIMHTQVLTDGVEKAYNDITGTSVIDDYRGIKVLSSYSKLDVPALDWVILAEIDYNEAIKSIYFIRNNILFLTILVSFIVFVISFIFSKRITSPLMNLSEAAANIKSGNLNVRLPRIAHDEIGQLTTSFNSMAESLRDKENELKSERNKRITAMIDGQEMERQRLSRELHDGLGQSLIALKLKLETIHGKDVCAINKTIKEVKTNVDGTINEIRRISNDLMPAVLDEFGLMTALKNMCEEISENANIDLRFAYEGKFNDLDKKLTIYLFRIMQEAINNIVKHAKASDAEIHLIRQQHLVLMKIFDNGKGWNVDRPHKNTGNGIPNMRERIRLLDGKIEILSESGIGTQISIEIPLNTLKND
ncbi:MAG: sensor histidine kinase [Bacteroidales bacterium]